MILKFKPAFQEQISPSFSLPPTSQRHSRLASCQGTCLFYDVVCTPAARWHFSAEKKNQKTCLMIWSKGIMHANNSQQNKSRESKAGVARTIKYKVKYKVLNFGTWKNDHVLMSIYCIMNYQTTPFFLFKYLCGGRLSCDQRVRTSCRFQDAVNFTSMAFTRTSLVLL